MPVITETEKGHSEDPVTLPDDALAEKIVGSLDEEAKEVIRSWGVVDPDTDPPAVVLGVIREALKLAAERIGSQD